ncbi:hypothetical protein [Paraburkholderia sp. DGU8]|uniref:hypothetical protein n=1 Tax=Paraburkholderia sp. DGU8 TaxID=3161997 RepID=UPI0034679DCD
MRNRAVTFVMLGLSPWELAVGRRAEWLNSRLAGNIGLNTPFTDRTMRRDVRRRPS